MYEILKVKRKPLVAPPHKLAFFSEIGLCLMLCVLISCCRLWITATVWELCTETWNRTTSWSITSTGRYAEPYRVGTAAERASSCSVLNSVIISFFLFPSCVLSIGVWRSFTTRGRSTTSGSPRATSKDRSFSSTIRSERNAVNTRFSVYFIHWIIIELLLHFQMQCFTRIQFLNGY